MTKIILASTSPYRKKLLETLQISFVCQSPHLDEAPYKNGSLTRLILARSWALKKAEAVALHESETSLNKNNINDLIIIGSDQVVALENKIFSSPQTHETACSQLKQLRGKTHVLITAVSLIRLKRVQGELTKKYVAWENISSLSMRNLSDHEIERYVQKDKPLFCAGSYMLESLGISLFDKIETSDSTSIIGLPLLELSRYLREWEIPIP